MSESNLLLAALPMSEQQRLRPHFERVPLPQGTVLYAIGDPMRDAYFPLAGMVSLLALTRDGETVELATVGHDGVIGLPGVLRAQVAPYQMVVHIRGQAARLPSDVLRAAFAQDRLLQAVLLQYTERLLAQIAQSVVCHRFHTVSERLCRRLLSARDCVHADTFDLTQETVAQLLGTPRPKVTLAALELQDAGIIRYRHGKVTILNLRRLEASACECYHLLRHELDLVPAATTR